MTEKQRTDFNLMLTAMQQIKGHQTPEKLKRDSKKDWGLNYVEALEMSYENMQALASVACKRIKRINLKS